MKAPCVPTFWCEPQPGPPQSFWFAIKIIHFREEEEKTSSLHWQWSIEWVSLKKRKNFSSLNFWGFDAVVRLSNNGGYVGCWQKFNNPIIFFLIGKISFLHERMGKPIFLFQQGQPFFFFPLPLPPLRFFQPVCCYPSHKTASKVAFKERKQQKINCWK